MHCVHARVQRASSIPKRLTIVKCKIKAVRIRARVDAKKEGPMAPLKRLKPRTMYWRGDLRLVVLSY